jgi:hypothetical protein
MRGFVEQNNNGEIVLGNAHSVVNVEDNRKTQLLLLLKGMRFC